MDCPRPRTALLVDDSAIVRERLVQLIERIPNLAVVGVCEDADCAMDDLVRCSPDLLLLDIRLGSGAGMRVLRYTVRHHPAIRIIVLTDQVDDQTRRICLSRGAHHFVDKSKDFDTLPELLGALVRQGFSI